MPFIGIRKSIAAPIDSEPMGGTGLPTYGMPVTDNRAISAEISWTRNDNPFYCDDVEGETDNGITGGEITIGLAEVSEAMQTSVLGVKKDTETGVLSDTDAASPACGYGYIRVLRVKGKTTYEANWLIKVQFGPPDDETTTKGESIEWQTPTITGNIMGVTADASGNATYRRRKVFLTQGEAEAFLTALSTNVPYTGTPTTEGEYE